MSVLKSKHRVLVQLTSILLQKTRCLNIPILLEPRDNHSKECRYQPILLVKVDWPFLHNMLENKLRIKIKFMPVQYLVQVCAHDRC